MERSFWLSRTYLSISRKAKRIILLEFKRTSDVSDDGLNALARDRGWEVEVLPLDTGQRSVKEEEWLESLKIFGMSTEDGKTIVNRQVYSLKKFQEKHGETDILKLEYHTPCMICY